MEEKVDSALTTSQKRLKYDYDKRLCKTTAFKTNKIVFVERLPLAMGTNNLETTGKATHNSFLRRADRPYRILSVQRSMMTIDEKCVRNKISIGLGTSAPSSTNADVGRKRSAIRGKGAVFENKYHAPGGRGRNCRKRTE